MKLNNKKGFTLIELLAVIVVLAIIALIATPIVMNTIEKSKKGTAIESANNLIKSAEYYILQTKSRYGKVSVLDEKLNYSGNKPDLGEVEINKDGKSRIYTYLNGYCVTKDYENETPYATKTSKEECNWFATDNYETKKESIIISNNRNVKNYLIYGNSTQETRSGKNLYDYNNVPVSLGSKQDNGYFISGSTNIRFYTYQTLKNYIGQPVTISFDLTTSGDGDFLIYQYQSNGIGINFSETNKTMKANVKQRISVTGVVKELGTTESYSKGEIIVYKKGYTGSYLVNNIQFELGSTVTEYEPYGAMPSPEFPSEINNTGDLITKDNCASYGSDACDNIGKYVVQVKATGKNILDISKLEVGAYSTGLTQSSNTFSFKRTGTKNTSSIFTKIKLEAGTYTISGNLTQSDGRNGGYGVYDLEKKEYLVNRSSSGIGTSTFKVTESKIYSLGFFCNYNSEEGTQVTYSNIQLEYGSSATTYEPYREATTNIYLDEPLRKVGDYVDYIDYSNGKVVRNTNLKTFNGNEEWYQFGSNVALAKWDDGKTPSHGDNDITGIYSNLFRENKNAQTSANDNTFLTHNILNVDWIVINRNINVSDFKTLLANKNATFIYPLATPTEESISLPQIKTVEGTNYITVNTSTSPSNLKITTEK